MIELKLIFLKYKYKNSLNDDKIKLQKETKSLQSRMRTCEIDIGVKPKSYEIILIFYKKKTFFF